MRTLYRDVIHQFWWVALPLTTQNALSQFQPEWQCWEPETNWVRQPPEDAITDYHYFDFYQQGMTFEAFVREFAEWYAQNVLPPSWWGSAPMNLTTAFWLSRRRVSSAFLTINPDDRRPGTWPRRGYQNAADRCMPPRYMRICEPFGPEQRQGLWLYHVIEPERWAAMCERACGVRSGGIYAGHDNHFMATGRS